jgi:hypothetical protein
MGKKSFLGKKGFFFTVIAVYLVAALMLSTLFYNKYEMRKKASVENIRILAVNDFIKDIDSDLERGLYISGFRTLLGLEEYIATTGNHLDDTELAFNETFFTKSFNGYPITLLDNSSFSDWEERINSQAESIGIRVNFTIESLEVKQEDPWNVELYTNITMLVYDATGMASWNRSKTIHAQIPITGFEDPLYSLNSYGRVANVITPANSTNFVSGTDTTDTTVLLNHLENSLYIASATAPSFLMRLEGNFSTSSCCGIESLVDVDKMTAQGIPARSMSIVDYVYFGTRTTANLCINNSKAEPDMPSWFRLDSDDFHISTYQISAVSKSC